MSIVLFGIFLFSFAAMVIIHFVKDETISKADRSALFIAAVLVACLSGAAWVFYIMRYTQ